MRDWLAHRADVTPEAPALRNGAGTVTSYAALDDEVEELLEDAARRAEANDRKTVQPRDL